jgi:hypothetical protein
MDGAESAQLLERHIPEHSSKGGLTQPAELAGESRGQQSSIDNLPVKSSGTNITIIPRDVRRSSGSHPKPAEHLDNSAAMEGALNGEAPPLREHWRDELLYEADRERRSECSHRVFVITGALLLIALLVTATYLWLDQSPNRSSNDEGDDITGAEPHD